MLFRSEDLLAVLNQAILMRIEMGWAYAHGPCAFDLRAQFGFDIARVNPGMLIPVMTWPGALVDPILNVMHGFHLISDEMESDEHQKRLPVSEVLRMSERVGFTETFHRTFEMGLNNLLVAAKS